MDQERHDTAADAAGQPAAARPRSSMGDLGLRLASAAVLGGLAAALLYAGPLPFAAFVLAISLLMSWEWGHVVRQSSALDAVLLVHGIAVAAAVVLAARGLAALALILLIAGTLIIAFLRFGEKARLSALGVLYVGLPVVALVTLRNGPEPYGLTSVLFIIATVIATDTFAYFSGRLIGGAKLWPSVSPNKTWSGFLGGVGAAAIGGGIFANVLGANIGRLALVALALGIVAQGGDLAESALKRGFGVKDASGLIPGHGGFMDRMDGVVAAAVAAALVGLVTNVYAPARALLLGY